MRERVADIDAYPSAWRTEGAASEIAIFQDKPRCRGAGALFQNIATAAGVRCRGNARSGNVPRRAADGPDFVHQRRMAKREAIGSAPRKASRKRARGARRVPVAE
jgi:hypothetical protein